MILSLICLAALQSAKASDFFPVLAGTVRTYEQKSKSELLVNTIGKSIDMGGIDVIPVTEITGGSEQRTTYYRVESDQVTIVAYDINKPLAVPMPVLKVGTGKVTWDYQGNTGTGNTGERYLAHGEAKMAGQRSILGKKVDVLIVKLEAAVGGGMAGVTFSQTTVYARNIGMVEQSTIQRLGKKKIEASYHLVSIEKAP